MVAGFVQQAEMVGEIGAPPVHHRNGVNVSRIGFHRCEIRALTIDSRSRWAPTRTPHLQPECALPRGRKCGEWQ